MNHRGIVLLDKGPGREAMKRHCRAIGVSINTIEKLVEAELDQVGKKRRQGLFDSFDSVLEAAVEEGEGGKGNVSQVNPAA
jgi:hypothetical protein